MTAIVLRVIVNAAALWVATMVVKGVYLTTTSTTDKFATLLVVAAIFGIVNALIKPVVKLFTFPLVLLTLGLLTFVINAAMLELTAWISDRADLGFHVDSFFWSAILGALVISIVSWVLGVVVPDEG